MNIKKLAFALVLVLTLIASSTLPSLAQDEENNTFGPQDVFGLFMGALAQGDLILLNDGSVVSGSILNTEFTLENADGTQSYDRVDVFALGFATDDEDNTITRLYVAGAPGTPGAEGFRPRANFVEGTLMNELEQNIVLSDETALELSDLNSIVLSFDFQQAGRDPGRRIGFGQVFPIFTRMMGSMSNYDTVVTTDGSLASVVLDDRDSLVVNLDSPTFGSFSFPVEEVAWVEFGQNEGDRDVLVLQNGDRVSGTVSVDGTFSGSLGADSAQFSFDGSDLKSQFKQIVFQISLEIFGGGGGRGVVIRPDEN